MNWYIKQPINRMSNKQYEESTIMKNLQPEAFITKGKQRIKQFDKTIYLKDGDEFEIELFNPLSETILAKIQVNKSSIGNGIVLRPGERIFLERYLSDSKKFLFKTYSVDGNNQQVLKAIEANGLVDVSFFNQYNNYQPIWLTTTYNPNNVSYNSNNITYTSNYNNSSLKTLIPQNIILRSSNLSNQATLDMLETGRVEKGNESNQKFNTVDMDFYQFPFHNITWNIKPESNIVKDQMKIYCTECGAKRKKDSHKFCPHCGTKF